MRRGSSELRLPRERGFFIDKLLVRIYFITKTFRGVRSGVPLASGGV